MWVYLSVLGQGYPEDCICPKSVSNICCFSLVRVLGSRKQRVEVKVAPPTIIPSYPLAKCLFPGPMTLCSAGLEVLAPKKRVLLLGVTVMIPLDWKLRLPPEHFGLLISLNQQGKKEVAVPARVTDPGYQWETRLLLHSEDKEDCVWNPLWHLNITHYTRILPPLLGKGVVIFSSTEDSCIMLCRIMILLSSSFEDKHDLRKCIWMPR